MTQISEKLSKSKINPLIFQLSALGDPYGLIFLPWSNKNITEPPVDFLFSIQRYVSVLRFRNLTWFSRACVVGRWIYIYIHMNILLWSFVDFPIDILENFTQFAYLANLGLGKAWNCIFYQGAYLLLPVSPTQLQSLSLETASLPIEVC